MADGAVEEEKKKLIFSEPYVQLLTHFDIHSRIRHIQTCIV